MNNTVEENSTVSLSDGKLSIEIALHGAELVSVKSNDREFLWNGDAAYWKRHSPVLFPIIGSLWNGTYRVDGHEYAMSQHGIARDMDFTLVEKSQRRATFKLESNETTKQKYPFDFVLTISYEIINGQSIAVRWQVENPSANQTMYFSIGAHPAFLLRPDVFEAISSDKAVGGYFSIAKQGHRLTTVVRSHLGSGGCISNEKEALTLSPDGQIAIAANTFMRDAIVLEHSQVDAVELLSADKKPLIRVRFDAPLVGLWAPRKDEYSPFVCIEPWYGRADRVGFDGDFAEKDWQNSLNPSETFKSVYYIDVLG